MSPRTLKIRKPGIRPVVRPGPTRVFPPRTPGVARSAVRLPLSPAGELRDDVLFEDPVRASVTLFLPRYRLAREEVSGKERYRIALRQDGDGWVLSLELEEYPAPAIELAARDAEEVPHQVEVAGPLELLAPARGAAVLPDDGVVDRFAGGAIPQHRRLALVGDGYGGDVGGIQAGRVEGRCRGRDLGRPDLPGVVLDPAGPRKDLAELLLAEAPDVAVAVEDDGAGAGGALVEGEDVGHDRVLSQRG